MPRLARPISKRNPDVGYSVRDREIAITGIAGETAVFLNFSHGSDCCSNDRLARAYCARARARMCTRCESWDLYVYSLLRDKTSREPMDKYIGPLLIGKQDTLTDSQGWKTESFALMSRIAVHIVLGSSIN